MRNPKRKILLLTLCMIRSNDKIIIQLSVYQIVTVIPNLYLKIIFLGKSYGTLLNKDNTILFEDWSTENSKISSTLSSSVTPINLIGMNESTIPQEYKRFRNFYVINETYKTCYQRSHYHFNE